MILKFIQAESLQPLLVMSGAIASVVDGDDILPGDGKVTLRTLDGRRFIVLGTVESILYQLDQVGLSTMSVATIE